LSIYAQNHIDKTNHFPLDSFKSLNQLTDKTSSHNYFYKKEFYDELQILMDTSGSIDIKDLPRLVSQFKKNDTKNDYQPNAVYWAKLDLVGKTHLDQNYLFHFSSNGFDHSWENIKTWMISEHGDTLYQQTGHLIPNNNKPIPSELNLLEFPIDQQEKVTIYIRLEGHRQEERHKAKQISVDLIHRDMYPGAFEGYSFKGYFPKNNENPFRGNPITFHQFYTETEGEIPISTIHEKWSTIPKTDLLQTKHEPNKTYWLKAKFYGSPYFLGKQILHIAPHMGDDRYTFDYVDTYITKGDGRFSHQRTGDHVPQSKRVYNFWANFIQLELEESDTLEVYMRLEGTDDRFLMSNIVLFHVDKDSLFPSQISLGIEHGIFYGILAIQVLFFVILFLIERDRIHLYFSLTFFSVLLGEIASPDGYMYGFVVFSSLKDFSITFYYLAMFLGSLGIIKFTQHYFNYEPDHIYSKWLIPVFIVILAIVNTGASQQVEMVYDDFSSWQGLDVVSQYLVIAALVFSFYMAYKAPIQKNVSKRLYFIAFSPTLITCFALFMEQIIFTEIANYDFLIYFRFTILITATLLALTIGFRTNKLKEEKANAVKLVELEEKEKLRLKELSEFKARFYTNITHEFRTPLTVIMGINDELSNTTKQLNLPANKKEKILQNQHLIKRNSKNLLTLVNQLLDLSKSDSQELELQLKQGDILPYLNYLTESFYSKASKKDIRLVFYSELQSLIMDFDEQKIQHIIYNLLSNAIKFTPEKGKIVMHASLIETNTEPTLKLIVKDDGIGIPVDSLPHIFNRFYQVDDSHTRQEDGSGIGLSLTKDMVTLMGGNVSVESQMGTGTTFTITIPITNNAEASSFIPISILNDVDIEESDTDININNGEFDEIEQKPILLIVEDNKDVFSYLKLVLDQTYSVVAAANGEDGIEKAKEIIPDLIISDVMMPIKDGFELTKTLKLDKTTSHIPIILLTAKVMHDDKVEGLQIGADAYMTKPFDKQELLIRINKLIESRLVMQRHYSPTNNKEIAKDSIIQSEIITNEEPFIHQVKAIITAQLQNDKLNADIISKEMGISQSQLYRKVKALTGLSINNYIRNFRLQQSTDLLKNTTKDIAEIAYEVGFSSPSYFSRSFTKVYKRSPNAFRKEMAR
jgi:signal transduction histidine kinase/DNA-binding response OmpR family regulator